MKRQAVMAFGLVLWAGLLIGDQPATRAGEPDDDLAVVKRAVAQNATTPAPTPAAIQDDERPRARSGAKPQWLRVRVTENNGKRVRINVPLSLVRAVGDWPIDLCRDWDRDRWERDRQRCKLRLSEVLDALDAGQSLVEVDEDGGAKVRIWIE
jgi:hypothetical protein